jgi:hypothetical protein
MRAIVVAAAGCLAAILGACTHGRDFARPSNEALVLGHTTRAEIVARYGETNRQASAIVSEGAASTSTRPPSIFDAAATPGNYSRLTYAFSDTTQTVLVGGPASARVVSFVFWNDTLVAYEFISNFANDSSNFGDGKVALLKKGQTSKNEVTELLGPPSGRAVYPQVLEPGDEKYLYSFLTATREERLGKRLEIVFGGDEKLIEYRFFSDAAPLPRGQGGGTAVVPIIVPHK